MKIFIATVVISYIAIAIVWSIRELRFTNRYQRTIGELHKICRELERKLERVGQNPQKTRMSMTRRECIKYHNSLKAMLDALGR